ncbi:hypothetical protein C7402_10296 [Paraburkholderia unamae]|uniref:Uncharacterized protein n=1 Tax=Paraburkholderia unamae TaxID=219649 RepID=A0ABX5KT12_9BURK|nr:hypothetical protein C7402_10296 [Paraburkholderia unamae]
MTVVTSYGGNVVAGHEPGTHRAPGAQDLKGRVVIGTGGTISNSAAVDEDNDIYVAACQMLHKLVWTGSTLSQVAAGDAWCNAYPTINT